MAEGSSDQGGNYSVTIDENGIFEFADEGVRNEWFDLTLRKLLHEYTIRKLKENHKGDYEEIISCLEKGEEVTADVKHEIMQIREEYLEKNFGNSNTGILPDLREFEEFPNYFNDEKKHDLIELNKILKDQIKNELTNGIGDDLYKNLLLETIDKYGETIYEDGKIAAQSINLLKSETEQTLFWSVCGEGAFGMLADAAYADLMALATERETMYQIRERAKKTGISMSSTNDEFSAASAFIALNAKGEVYIASKPGVEIGQYISEIEIPILLKNPNVTKISLINTTDEFLLNLKNSALNSSNIEEFKNNSENLFDSNSKVLFERDGEIGNIDEKAREIVNQINNFTVEEKAPIENSNDNLNKPIDELNHEEESEQNERNKLQNMTKENIMKMTRKELSSEDYKKDFIEIMDEFERDPKDINKKELIATYIKKVYPNIRRNLIKDVDNTIAKSKLAHLKIKPNGLTPLALVKNWEKNNKNAINRDITVIKDKFNTK